MSSPDTTLATIPAKAAGDSAVSKTDSGRVRVCNALTISINRSWQVDIKPGSRPEAAFKNMAPLAFWSAGDSATGDIYLAAVAAHDAFWLGFDTEDGAPHAVTINLNGNNLLTGQSDPSNTLTTNPANYLIVPDQPWLDARISARGMYEQLVPQFQQAKPTLAGAVLKLTVFALADADLGGRLDQTSDDPQPLYATTDTQAKSEGHAWRARVLHADAAALAPCARLTVFIVDPEQFSDLTGVALSDQMFQEQGAPPAPFDPFQ